MPRRHEKVKQTRLMFVPVESSSPAAERSPGSSPFRPAKLRYEYPSKGLVRRGQLQLEDFSIGRNRAASSSTSASSDERPGSSALRQTSDTLNKTPRPVETSSPISDNRHAEEISSDDEDAVKAPARRRRRNVVTSEIESDNESESASASTPTRRQQSSDSEASEQRTETSRRPSTRRLRSRRAVQEEDSETEIRSLPQTRSVTRGQQNGTEALSPTKRTKSSAVDLSGLASAETSDADELVTRPTGRKRRAAEPSATFVVDDDSDDSDDVVVSSPAKRRRRENVSEEPRTPRKTSEQDRLDLEEDLRDLQDSAVTETRTRGRFVDSVKAKRQKHLEILRRRRAGEKVISSAESEENGEDDSESTSDSDHSFVREELGQRNPFSEAEDSDVELDIPANEDLDQYEKDFVLEDSEGELGVPTEEMPFEFTRHKYKPLKACFRDVVEWMVHNKLNPAFARSDEMYQSAFRKLDDEVKGRTGSQFISAVWNADFRRALLARPHIEITAFPTTANHPCDACKRSGHPASSDVKLYGKPYSLETLEPLADEEDSDNDGLDRDRDGHVLPDEDTHFLLGRHCKAKAEMTHTLIHWRYHLNEWVTDYLERKGYFEDSKVVERNQWSQKKKSRKVDGEMDSIHPYSTVCLSI
ncbi:hypothetical protein T310_1072 [Rasamsonia emersonii CBS 393.64]|uniref:DUF4211 domain-containing protein n=1 Tax=Rasamsonia emersonii (strain ATCC 16479 / CBS 393.64 / IMI 116815) TaxID=1408163 RepID=A0A0F4Z4U3_RASE3|nr:hypothetical protein T310_1072 [Rasamsonia emersonii CBS 393.64]KKA24893.1 hypothetical protein T310_1072 [Rasamsonia emersonii CBS 393.64]